MSSLGIIHVTFGFLALITGTVVLLLRKGTRAHRTIGHLYLSAMLSLNITSLFIYDLFGSFGPFHWMALASLATLTWGMVPVFRRQPKGRWLDMHGGVMAGSYVGLVAATAAEVTSRLPGGWNSFSAGVTAVTIALVIGVGIYLIRLKLPSAMRSTPRQFQDL